MHYEGLLELSAPINGTMLLLSQAGPCKAGEAGGNIARLGGVRSVHTNVLLLV